ncbi:MAG TPA: M4 family metallopeptidase [Flavobacterium sp.]|nr:M4 family metallopeptidase [Flavobacterium sp.]
MKNRKHLIGKVARGVLLGSFLVMTPMNFTFAANFNQVNAINDKELPKPIFQNAYGTFMVTFHGREVSSDYLVNNFNNYFELDNDHNFELVRESKDEKTGFTHLSYQHYFKGVEIEGDMVFVHSKNGKVSSINGQLIKVNDFNTIPSVSDSRVKEIVQNEVKGRDLKTGEIELLIIKSMEGKQATLKLVKKINVSSIAPLEIKDYYIDAHTGEIIYSVSKIHQIDTPSVSTTYNRGNQSITVDSYNGSYRLKDNARNIHTLNGAGWNGSANPVTGELTGTITEYTNNVPNFTSEDYKPAVQVHWGISKTYDYYQEVHDRSSYDGNGSIIRNYYDYPQELVGTAMNAFAVDQGGVVAMVYGNGMHGTQQLAYPMVNLDITAHEYSHLIIGRNETGGLNYQGESGALNESFADMFGAAVEFYVNDNPNWTIGEGIWYNGWGTPDYMRNMANPNSAPEIVGGPQPDTYEGNYWADTSLIDQENDYGGVHINSGVGNYWFYLLSEGGSGTNDNGDDYSVEGITIQKAEQIAYSALMTGLTPTATFYDAYNATQQSAIALYGEGSNEWQQVVNAWYAVGIGDNPTSNESIEMKTNLRVYPNPVSGDEITIESNVGELTTVEMYDLYGKKIVGETVLDNVTTINVQNYSAGIYLLKFKSSLGEYHHKLIIK